MTINIYVLWHLTSIVFQWINALNINKHAYTIIDPFRQRSNQGIILNAVFNNSAQEAISTFSTQSG